MAKKKINDDFEGDFDDENFEEKVPEYTEPDDVDNSEEESEIKISDEEDNLDIVIEIDEDDLDLTTDEVAPKKEIEESESEDFVFSKHKIQGKHSLKYDSIFKGKKEDPTDELDIDQYTNYHKDTIEVDKSSNYYSESIDNESYIRSKLLKEKVYSVLNEHTELNFLNNRRKPSKVDFNKYYQILKDNLERESFTNVELFNELSVYFSDNLFNMFKLLDNKWRNLIISELQDHIGRRGNSKEITNRNIYIGTEVEFISNQYGEEKHITGVVIEVDYENSIFKVNSYEKVYDVSIEQITKILNNTKFKYNLNKLNNIDFL